MSEKAFWGLPQEVRYCKLCVMSNQRPSSYPEFKHTRDRICPTLRIDEDHVCDACRYAVKKLEIDWAAREQELLKLLDQHRSKDGSHDCIVPGSGGKDSVYAAHILKNKYGMHPLTVTWPPILYTDYGYQNFLNWLNIGGFDNLSYRPNGQVHRLLTRLSILNLLHPFQSFMLGQKNLAPRLAIKYKIPLIFYGESEAEYGNAIAETNSSLRDRSYYTSQNLDQAVIGGVPIAELKSKYGVSTGDLEAYLPLKESELNSFDIQVHYLGYYLKWVPQEAYYYAVENCGFKCRPHRTEGTYSKYNSIDDKIDDLHYFTTYVKFGLGRASYDAAQEIRNKHLTREEGVALVKKYDGEYPQRYLKEVLDYLEITEEQFLTTVDSFRSPHLWEKTEAGWKLRNPIWESTTN